MNEVEIATTGMDIPVWLKRLEKYVHKVLEARSIDHWIVSVLLCDENTMSGLNRKYRHREGPTDVLSFSQLDGDFDIPENRIYAGDIVISLPTMEQNARKNFVSEEEELKRLIIHGILHLEGLNHDQSDIEMIELQEKMMQSFKKERLY